MIKGHLKTGEGAASGFTQVPWVVEQLEEQLGITPYPGTLNLVLDSASAAAWDSLRNEEGFILEPPQREFCNSRCYPIHVEGRIPAAVLIPEVEGYPEDKIEVIAALPLREELGLCEGQLVTLQPWQPPAIEAVIFDVDGTLVDTLQAFLEVARIAADPYGFGISPQQIADALNGHKTDFWEDIVPHDRPNRDHLKKQLHNSAMDAWPGVLQSSATLIDGTEQVLRALAGKGVKLGIVTGNKRGSFEPLEAAGLMELFDSIITSEHVENRKPHPEGLLRCAADLGIAVARAVYVGDTAIDMTASHAAGMWSFGVLSGAADSPAISRVGAHRLGRTHARLMGAFRI